MYLVISEATPCDEFLGRGPVVSTAAGLHSIMREVPSTAVSIISIALKIIVMGVNDVARVASH